MNPLDPRAFRAEMDRMRRQRQRVARLAWSIIIAAMLLTVIGTAWFLIHPEAIGAFAGRIIAAAKAEQ